jgi:hypothetical protein
MTGKAVFRIEHRMGKARACGAIRLHERVVMQRDRRDGIVLCADEQQRTSSKPMRARAKIP